MKSTLSLSSLADTLPSEEFLEALPPSLRGTVTSTDDGTEILIGEISVEKWGDVIECYPVYVMEVEGSDPAFEQYLKERDLELRKRRLSLQKKVKNSSLGGAEGAGSLRSSFIASSQPTSPPPSSSSVGVFLEGECMDEDIDRIVERLSTELQNFSLVIGNEVMTDEEIILHEEIQRIQNQVLLSTSANVELAVDCVHSARVSRTGR